MATRAKVQELTLDPSTYPRGNVDEDRVLRYREKYEAGEEMGPPLIVLRRTTAVLDGWHRLTALQRLGREEVDVEYRPLPDGMTPKLFAASLTNRAGRGDLSEPEQREIALEFLREDDTRTAEFTAQALGLSPRTVRHWASAITEERRQRDERRRVARRHAAGLLLGLGMSQAQVAKALDVSQRTISSDGNMPDLLSILTDRALLAETLALIPADRRADAKALLAQAEEDTKAEVKAARERARRREAWGDVVHGARLLAVWAAKNDGFDPEATDQEIAAVLADITAFTTVPGRNR